ncbi:MAG: hypothetical protein RL264_2847 [Bacteroidota bacterium]|jgi:predicted DNA-binding transcriptional regulator YafY
MSQIKHALIRYRIIDRMLRNKFRPYPSKEDFRQACEEALFGSTSGANICDSTIEKDIFALRMEHDAPIKFSKRNNGYFYSDPNFSINDVPLSEDELSSIKFAVDTLRQFREVPVFQQFGNAIDKIVDRISVGNFQEPSLDNYIAFESVTSVGGNEFLPILLEAIQSNSKVWFTYMSFVKGVEKPRKVTPLFLKEYRNRWYLISFDAAKGDFLTFGLDRMADVKKLDEPGDSELQFDAANFFKYSIGITTYDGLPEKVILKAEKVAARYIESQPFHATQQVIEKEKDHTIFELEVLISEELIRSLLSYGGEIEVIKPKKLKKILAERVSAMAKIYLK